MNKSNQYPTHASIRAALLNMFGFTDMLTGEEIPNFKAASYHHLNKDADGGAYTVSNGVMLLLLTHRWAHNVLEVNDPQLYELLMECLDLYKECIIQGNTELIDQFQKEIQPKVKTLVHQYNPKNL